MARQPSFSSHDVLLDGRATDTLNIHGFKEAEARAVVEKLVRSSSGKLIHVITGKGRGSPGQPVLKNLVRSCSRARSRHWSRTGPSTPAKAAIASWFARPQ